MKVRVTRKTVVMLVVAVFLFKRFMPVWDSVVYNKVVMYKRVWVVLILAYVVLNQKQVMG